MRPDDKDKLNQCLEILDSTDLGLSLVWLWTWSTVNSLMEDESFKINVTKDEMWDNLAQAVSSGYGFSLEYGAEQHYEDVRDWMQVKGYITDLMFEEDEDELDTVDSI